MSDTELSKYPEGYLYVHPNTIFRQEFLVQHYLENMDFEKEIVKFARDHDVNGYIIFPKILERRAYGVFEGTRDDLTKLEQWIMLHCIPAPFANKCQFMLAVQEYNPQYKTFEIVNKVPARKPSQDSASDVRLH